MRREERRLLRRCRGLVRALVGRSARSREDPAIWLFAQTLAADRAMERLGIASPPWRGNPATSLFLTRELLLVLEAAPEIIPDRSVARVGLRERWRQQREVRKRRRLLKPLLSDPVLMDAVHRQAGRAWDEYERRSAIRRSAFWPLAAERYRTLCREYILAYRLAHGRLPAGRHVILRREGVEVRAVFQFDLVHGTRNLLSIDGVVYEVEFAKTNRHGGD